MYKKLASIVCTAIVALVPTLMLPEPSVAVGRVEQSGQVQLPAKIVSGKYVSTLKLTKNGKTTTQRGKYQTGASRTVVTAPSGAFLNCNQFYSFADSNGKYTTQHACGGSTAPWGFKIAGAVCGIVTSPVAEAGMSWTRNGVNQPRQAPHSQGCAYQFHGPITRPVITTISRITTRSRLLSTVEVVR